MSNHVRHNSEFLTRKNYKTRHERVKKRGLGTAGKKNMYTKRRRLGQKKESRAYVRKIKISWKRDNFLAQLYSTTGTYYIVLIPTRCKTHTHTHTHKQRVGRR